MDTQELHTRFTHHAPNAEQIQSYGLIRGTARSFAELLVKLCPASRELSLAMTHLEQAVMWANAAIARRSAQVSCEMCNGHRVEVSHIRSGGVSVSKWSCQDCGALVSGDPNATP